MEAQDDQGWTPLLYAAFSGSGRRVEVVRYLLDYGATVKHRERHGWTALHLACREGHAGVVCLLLQRGADVMAVDGSGMTPLLAASRYGRHDIVLMLLEHCGSDVDAEFFGGWTPCHWACSHGHSGVLRQLLEAGADPTVREAAGRTSLDLAAGEGHHDCIRVLQEWHRAYTFYRTRSVREATFVVANSDSPLDAAPAYLVDRVASGLTMPKVHVSSQQQHAQPSDYVDEEGHAEVGPVAIGGVVSVYAMEELTGELFVELVELMEHMAITVFDL